MTRSILFSLSLALSVACFDAEIKDEGLEEGEVDDGECGELEGEESESGQMAEEIWTECEGAYEEVVEACEGAFEDVEEELEEVDVILKDPMEEWKAHTAKTLEYLSKIDFQ